ncbi:polyphenol oxidase family protein [Kocuria carniphila]|uniref:Polyphenol oxidase family protein n=1 Tax=Kocuria carniphila TaxID=262208 RepID=A0ABV3V6F3_9MICC
MWFTDRHAGAAIAFTDADEGNVAAHTGEDPSEVAAHRAALEVTLGLPAGSLRFMRQVHGTTVVSFSTGTTDHSNGQEMSNAPEAPEADAAISDDGTPLAVLTADCLPVVFVAERAETTVPLTAVAHAGRRGLLDGVLQNTVRELRERGAESITAWVGPAICGSCYEVPDDMRTESAHLLPGIETVTSWQTPGLDLPGAARTLLEGLDVRVSDSSADRSEWCTLEHDALYSYRRDKTTSRLAGVVWVPSATTSAGKDTP